jgi:hypothetical protein
MDGERSKRALARIEAALARIEAATHRSSGASSAELEALQGRHTRLRTAVMEGLDELESLIQGSQG